MVFIWYLYGIYMVFTSEGERWNFKVLSYALPYDLIRIYKLFLDFLGDIEIFV